MITPQKFEKIINKLPQDKVELEKVKLGLLQDGTQAAKQLQSINEELNGLKRELKSIQTAFNKNEDEGTELFKYLQKVIRQVDSDSKKLGITRKIVELTPMEKAVQEFRRAIKL